LLLVHFRKAELFYQTDARLSFLPVKERFFFLGHIFGFLIVLVANGTHHFDRIIGGDFNG
jgi:hypothetical protein